MSFKYTEYFTEVRGETSTATPPPTSVVVPGLDTSVPPKTNNIIISNSKDNTKPISEIVVDEKSIFTTIKEQIRTDKFYYNNIDPRTIIETHINTLKKIMPNIPENNINITKIQDLLFGQDNNTNIPIKFNIEDINSKLLNIIHMNLIIGFKKNYEFNYKNIKSMINVISMPKIVMPINNIKINMELNSTKDEYKKAQEEAPELINLLNAMIQSITDNRYKRLLVGEDNNNIVERYVNDNIEITNNLVKQNDTYLLDLTDSKYDNIDNVLFDKTLKEHIKIKIITKKPINIISIISVSIEYNYINKTLIKEIEEKVCPKPEEKVCPIPETPKIVSEKKESDYPLITVSMLGVVIVLLILYIILAKNKNCDDD